MCSEKNIIIKQVVSSKELADVTAARDRFYKQRRNYLASVFTINTDSDDLDQYSYIYAAYNSDNEIVGTIRLKPHNYEIDQYIDEKTLESFLDKDFRKDYLEISRLVLDQKYTRTGLTEALITYAGLMTSLLTNYTRYFAYARPEIKDSSFNFLFDSGSLVFNIEDRGLHNYELFKGSFTKDFSRIFKDNIDTVVTMARK